MFNSDPSIGKGRMIHNSLGNHRLNTPPSPNEADPLRAANDPKTHLDTFTSSSIEDQALTNLLKLHYQEDCFSQGVEPQVDWKPDPILYSCFRENLAEASQESDGELAIPDMIFSPLDQDEANLNCDPSMHGILKIHEAAEILLKLFAANLSKRNISKREQIPRSVSDKNEEAVVNEQSGLGDVLDGRAQMSELEVNAVEMLLRLSNAAL